MKQLTFYVTGLILFISACTGVKQTGLKKDFPEGPEEKYGSLFYDVQSREIFRDSKTFVDCVPRYPAEEIRNNYRNIRHKSDSSIKHFVRTHFIIPPAREDYVSDSAGISGHICHLWKELKRPADKPSEGTLIPLPHPYVVPGGRFREMYYWDSYFTMLGLRADSQQVLIRSMVDNFAFLINTYGHIPNGNRTYYLSRSQPPFFVLMLELLAELQEDTVLTHYLPEMEKEYLFWMDGSQKLKKAGQAQRRVVRMQAGEIMNRYWDDKAVPRPESYLEDVHTAAKAVIKNPSVTKEEVYRHIRAAAESGWDFSGRWLGEGDTVDLSTIHTTHIVPVDLNCLLYQIETTISKSHGLAGNKREAERYRKLAEARKKAILKYCWDEDKKFFTDYNFYKNKRTGVESLAGVFPLFFRLSGNEQSVWVAAKIKDSFLKEGGVVTTLKMTGQQWDAPNGWAPFQWITYQGLRNYGHLELAGEIRKRWMKLNEQVYEGTYKLLEKYNVVDLSKKGGGGEYPNQDGFGWTNGVYQDFFKNP